MMSENANRLVNNADLHKTVQYASEVLSGRLNIVRILTRPRGYKTFFMLSSAEHKILDAHKF